MRKWIDWKIKGIRRILIGTIKKYSINEIRCRVTTWVIVGRTVLIVEIITEKFTHVIVWTNEFWYTRLIRLYNE